MTTFRYYDEAAEYCTVKVEPQGLEVIEMVGVEKPVRIDPAYFDLERWSKGQYVDTVKGVHYVKLHEVDETLTLVLVPEYNDDPYSEYLVYGALDVPFEAWTLEGEDDE